MTDSLFKKLKEILVDTFEISPEINITRETSLTNKNKKQNLNLDSLQIIKLAEAFEEKLEIKQIYWEKIIDLNSLGGYEEYIRENNPHKNFD